MTVRVVCEWRSHHEVEPPADVSEEEFRVQLEESYPSNEEAWQHALDQCDSQICELTEWEVVS